MPTEEQYLQTEEGRAASERALEMLQANTQLWNRRMFDIPDSYKMEMARLGARTEQAS